MNIGPIPENNQENSEDKRLVWITNSYLAGNITDDNPSEINDLTGLEQAIAFSYNLNPDNEDEMLEIESIRLDIEERIKYQMNGGSYLVNQPITFFSKHPDEIVLDLDRNIAINHFGSLEEYEDWIDRVSRKVFEGLITEDNPSARNQYTGLDQLIISQVGLDFNLEEDCMAFYIIKLDLRSKETQYQGGSIVPEMDKKALEIAITRKSD